MLLSVKSKRGDACLLHHTWDCTIFFPSLHISFLYHSLFHRVLIPLQNMTILISNMATGKLDVMDTFGRGDVGAQAPSRNSFELSGDILSSPTWILLPLSSSSLAFAIRVSVLTFCVLSSAPKQCSNTQTNSGGRKGICMPVGDFSTLTGIKMRLCGAEERSDLSYVPETDTFNLIFRARRRESAWTYQLLTHLSSYPLTLNLMGQGVCSHLSAFISATPILYLITSSQIDHLLGRFLWWSFWNESSFTLLYLKASLCSQDLPDTIPF